MILKTQGMPVLKYSDPLYLPGAAGAETTEREGSWVFVMGIQEKWLSCFLPKGREELLPRVQLYPFLQSPHVSELT